IRVSCALVNRRPRKFGIGFDFSPDHVVEDPEAEILHDRANTKNIVIGADNPDGGSRLHHAAAGSEPRPGEIVIAGKAAELVPGVADGVDARVIRSLQGVRQLEIVRWVSEDEIDGSRRQLRHSGDAVANKNTVRLRTL